MVFMVNLIRDQTNRMLIPSGHKEDLYPQRLVDKSGTVKWAMHLR